MARRKRPTYKENVSNHDKVVRKENPNSWLGKTPTWRFSGCDRSISRWNLHNCERFTEDILEKLASFEGMTWGEIQNASGGRRAGTNHHFVYVSELHKEARKIAEKLQHEELFSLRLTGKKRLYGSLSDGIFNVVWYDQEHEIYKSTKRNT